MGWNRLGPDQRLMIWYLAAVLWGRIIVPFLIGYAVVRLTPERKQLTRERVYTKYLTLPVYSLVGTSNPTLASRQQTNLRFTGDAKDHIRQRLRELARNPTESLRS